MDPRSFGKYIDAARGIIPCDLVLKDITFLDVFTSQWRRSDIAIHDGYIVGIESGLKSVRKINCSGKYLVPGFIDAHVHIESSLLTPPNFESVVLPRGTTTAICDPHELANVMGLKGIEYFLKESEKLSLDLKVMLSSCVPATHFETNGGGRIDSKQLLPLLKYKNALGLAEMMNVPGVINKDPKVLKKLQDFSDRPIDGHSPLLKGKDLSAYLITGVSTCHECSTFDEAKEKISKGMKVWIREGSVAKDLHTLAPLLTIATSDSVGFCTDDRNPLDIANEGHLDFLIREAMKAGIPSEVVYKSASYSVAKHYGLKRKGAIAPGYQADLVVLQDKETCSIDFVFKSGIPVERSLSIKTTDKRFVNTIKIHLPSEAELEGPQGRVHVIGVEEGKIITDHFVLDSNDVGVARLSVIERYGKYSKPSNGYVKGFGEGFNGAIASSVGHDSHNLIAVGKSTSDMKTAFSHLAKIGGGFCVVKDKKVLASLALPFGGLMTTEDPRVIEKKLFALREASESIGCHLPEPFLQLAFLSLPVIPKLKLTDKGLIDVEKFKQISVRAS